jgi:phosphoribosylglycinamide formyltransferase-1
LVSFVFSLITWAEYGKKSEEMNNKKFHIAIFASGSGTNAEKLISHFKNHPSINVNLIVCNNPKAKVLEIASKNEIEILLIEKERFFEGDGYVEVLKKKNIEWIILSGFLWKVPAVMIRAFSEKIINIHPALLPQFGGKGMYGKYVHEAVLAARASESGITIHKVDEIYDHGKIIFQAVCPVSNDDTATSLAKKVQQLEHLHFAPQVEKLILSDIN